MKALESDYSSDENNDVNTTDDDIPVPSDDSKNHAQVFHHMDASNISTSSGFFGSGGAGYENGATETSIITTQSPPLKTIRLEEPRQQYSTIAQKLMAKMGYQEGKGLGKEGQGIVEPVAASKQRGRRGLGLIIKGLIGEGPVVWDQDKEHIQIEEDAIWMRDSTTLPCLDIGDWIQEGPRKETIEDETTFCDEEIVSAVLKCKSVFDSLEPEELRKARTRSNPFETIRGVFFLNRAAMKMANMDAVFDFMFTEPKSQDGKPVLHKNELLYFADVCAGPGGFSEYVLWRKKWRAKGFGFTLKEQNDFKLEDFFAGPPER